MLTTKVTARGPLFDGRAKAAIAAFVDDATEQVAQEAENEVRTHLGSALRNPTGFYESRVQTDRQRADAWVVDDDDVVYGPWLEGTSSRNRTTGFAGYGAFRRAADRVRSRATPIAQRLLRSKYMPRMR